MDGVDILSAFTSCPAKKFGTESTKLVKVVLISSGDICWVELSGNKEFMEDIYSYLDKIIIYPI